MEVGGHLFRDEKPSRNLSPTYTLITAAPAYYFYCGYREAKAIKHEDLRAFRSPQSVYTQAPKGSGSLRSKRALGGCPSVDLDRDP